MSDFEKLINASDLIEWIMEAYPDWCVGAVRSIVDHVEALPPKQPEYTEHEENILTMLFEITKLIIDLQGGYMEMTDGRSFDNNDLFGLAEKLGINY